MIDRQTGRQTDRHTDGLKGHQICRQAWGWVQIKGNFPQRKVERQVKVLIRNLAIFFQFPSKLFLPISFKFSCGKLLPKTEGTMLRREPLHEYWKISGTTIQFIFCQVRLLVMSLVSILTHPFAPHRVYSLSRYFGRKVQLGTGKQTAKTWFGFVKQKENQPNYQ